MKGRTRSEHRAAQHTPLPPFNETTIQTEGGHQHTDGDASNTPPALHSPCHPPSANPPALPQWPHPPPRRGGSAQRIPHHTNTTDTHSPPTHRITWQGTMHDTHCSTRQHCNGMSRARATPLHWVGQQQHTPPPFHTPRRMDTIHSSTHLLLLIHVHTPTNDHDQRTTINVQSLIIDQRTTNMMMINDDQ